MTFFLLWCLFSHYSNFQPVILGWLIAHADQKVREERKEITDAPLMEMGTMTTTRTTTTTRITTGNMPSAEWLWKGFFYASLLLLASTMKVVTLNVSRWLMKELGFFFRISIIQVCDCCYCFFGLFLWLL